MRGHRADAVIAGEPELKMLQWSSVSLADASPRLAPLFELRKLIALAQPVRLETLQGMQDVGAFLGNRESSVAVDSRLRKLTNRSSVQLLPESPVRAYFGLLHAHTFASDGIGDARDAYRMAREIAGLDFFALTDHSEYWWKKASPDWGRQQILAREESREDFVALAGFEYSHPLQGHVVVLNSNHWTSFLQTPTLGDFFNWLAAPEQSAALAIFAHPGFHTYRNWFDLRHFRFERRIADRLIGVETIHKNVWQKSLRGYAGEVSFLDEALNAGWRVGPIASQDNHTPFWGVSDQSRIAVLMNNLSKNELLSALRRRHFYSTQSPQLQLALGLYDGAQLKGILGDSVGRRNVSDSKTFVKLRLFEPNPLLQPQKIEFLINGRKVRTLTFLDSPSPLSAVLEESSKRAGSWWERWIHNGIVTVKPFEWFLSEERAAEPEIFEVDLPLVFPHCSPLDSKHVQKRWSVVVRFYQGDRSQYFTQTSPLTVHCD